MNWSAARAWFGRGRQSAILQRGAVLAAAGFAASAGAQPSFQGLGFLNDEGFGPGIAYAVTPDGSVVVGESVSPNGFEAFRWTESEGMVGLGDIPGGYFASFAYAVSGDGSVVAGASDDGSAGEGGAAFMWTAADGMIPIGSLGGPTTYGQGQGISLDGSVIVGGSQSPRGIEAFRWTAAGGMVSLGDLAGGEVLARATACSGDGSVVVGYGSSSGTFDEAFVWTEQTGMVGLGGPGRSALLAVSRDGQVGAGQRAGLAVRWTQSTGFVNLGRLAGSGQSIDIASSISGDGLVVGGLADFNATKGTGEAFIWDEVEGIRSLRDVLVEAGLGSELIGWSLFDVRGISQDGSTLVGYGFHGSEQEPWIARLPRACRADFNGDGAVNTLDVLEFLNAFADGDAGADFDGNGVVDTRDVLAFLNVWAADC
ncbi:MAG TPA: GC-type dockerin domain-anchored protein [Phycisphaerales bacterium]|nr:GC-type dockerin domain-anchored protein [Phycisphaerales bacterium]